MESTSRTPPQAEPSLFDLEPKRSALAQIAQLPRAFSRWLNAPARGPEAASLAHRPQGRSPIVFWAPVWIPLILLAQVALRGFGPSLSESRRLDDAEERMLARYDGAVAEQRELHRLLRAQSDPIYLERERRLLRTPESPLRRR